MYRLVVILMTLSLPGSEAAGPEPKWSFFLGDAQNQETEPLILEGTPLQRANDRLVEEIKYPIYSVARHHLVNGNPLLMSLYIRFLELKSIEVGLDTDTIICDRIEVVKLINFEKGMDEVLHGRLHKINIGRDSFLGKKATEISKKFFTHCMAKLKQKFERLSNDPELREAFDRMRVFESFIDEEKAAQPQGSPRYCNEGIQVFDLANYWKVISKVGTEAGKTPAVVEENVSYFGRKESREMMLELLRGTCWHQKLNGLGRGMRLIMESKRSLLMNREWNLVLDCDENMGRFQLCNQAWAKFEKFHGLHEEN